MYQLAVLAMELLPGGRCVYALFEESDSTLVRKAVFRAGDWNSAPLSPSDELPRIQQFRSDQVLMEWVSESLLPWRKTEQTEFRENMQIGFEQAGSDRFLVIRLDRGRGSRLKDCLIIEVEPQMHFYGISRTGETLNPTNKRLIGLTVALSIKNKFNQLDADEKHFGGLKARIIAQREELIGLKKSLDARNHQFADSVVSFSKYLLQEMGRKSSKTFLLSESAIEKLRNYNQPIEWLEPSLLKAAEMASNLSDHSVQVSIDGGDLLFEKPEQETPSKPVPASNADRYASTIEFLNRYESAAKRAEEAGEKITGKSIAAYCKPPVSPPAISDVLRKHKKKIISLLNKYPGQWTTLRSSFKPMIRIYEQKKGGREEIA